MPKESMLLSESLILNEKVRSLHARETISLNEPINP